MPENKALSEPQKALIKLGLARDIDLALHIPLRYEDETRIVKLRDAREGDTIQFEGSVTDCQVQYRPRRQLVVKVDDGTDTCVLRFFTFYPSQQKSLAVGARLRIRGEIKGGFLGWQMVHPAWKAAGGDLPQALTPVYSTVAGLPQPYLRKAVAGGLERADLSETIPPDAPPAPGRAREWTLKQALQFLHHPAPEVSLATLEDRSHPAWQRLKAEELLAQQLSQVHSRREHDRLRAPALRARPGGLHEQLLAALPFQLTQAQRRVSEEIAQGLERERPLHRLLQGDVGSGKTVVAALAAAIAIDAGWQCALMAPTEILAEQHFRKLIGWLEPLLMPLGLRVAWLTGSQRKKERTEMLELIASGEAALVVGTHAVIQEQVQFKALALAIIDEQHRFGVEQRLALRGKMNSRHPRAGGDDGIDRRLAVERSETPALRASAGVCALRGSPPAYPGQAAGEEEALDSRLRGNDGEGRGNGGEGCGNDADGSAEPHLLMMSATPIPRTLAMSYYADLDVSTIDELPPGRTPVVTKLISDSRRDEVVERIRSQVAQGRQVYWVCPLIEESETLDLTNATATHQQLSEALPGVLVGLLHSRMPVPEKKAVMALFTGGQMGVLVATTVIEVGVDVPNASLMVIEHAERFGLSQLHQLRGRVGRGAAASACVLLYSAGEHGRLGDTARARLKAMAETSDGFEIARRDLEIRGPGEFLGARQSGAPLLRFADLALDAELLEWAREVAPHMLDRHPDLAERHVSRWLGGKSEYLKA
ncbi:ATP-dependent DNA helicase RecG [Ramlibacter alkalitolerans]|uniref:ATP-dependent DNA helicase RecG n=1 Tax=Ramlibacter alkalitolerans TaxID=2039631 RepID=UPI001F2EFCDB|nr:ATP-dependent DNA helicase RecG [Ramlibacter alkalitolerans]